MLNLTYTASGNVFCFIIAVNNTIGVTSGAGTAYLPVHLSSPPVLVWVMLLDLLFSAYCFVDLYHRYILVFEH